ncbi:hypothetical protein LSAT2_023943, partial [Lamellibrachia satsuma]
MQLSYRSRYAWLSLEDQTNDISVTDTALIPQSLRMAVSGRPNKRHQCHGVGSLGKASPWEGRVPGKGGFLGRSGPWEGRVPGKGGFLGRSGPWEGRVPGKGGFLGRSGPWEGRVPGKVGSLGRAGSWEGRVPGKGEQPGISNIEVDGCHSTGADVLSSDKPGFP